jgi:hypothetical protein
MPMGCPGLAVGSHTGVSAPPPEGEHSCLKQDPQGNALWQVPRPFCSSNIAADRNVRAPTWWHCPEVSVALGNLVNARYIEVTKRVR